MVEKWQIFCGAIPLVNIKNGEHDDDQDWMPDFHLRERSDNEFTAKDNNDAKRKVLNIVKRFIRRLPKPAKEYLINVIAYPDKGEVKGPKLLRLRYGFDNRRILRVKNPDKALVQGYGPKQWDEVTGQHTVRATP